MDLINKTNTKYKSSLLIFKWNCQLILGFQVIFLQYSFFFLIWPINTFISPELALVKNGCSPLPEVIITH